MDEITKEEMRKRLGNVTQLQDLLFGEKTKHYDSQLEHYNQRFDKLESDFKTFQSVIDKRLNVIENSLNKKIDSTVNYLAKKIKYLSLINQDETSKLKEAINSLRQDSGNEIHEVRNILDIQVNSLNTEITRTKTSLDRDIQSLKQQLSDQMVKHLSELDRGKVSRSDLAEILFELCLKVKGSDLISDFKEPSNHEVKANFLLPEEKGNEQK